MVIVTGFRGFLICGLIRNSGLIGVHYDVNNEPHETMRFMIKYANKNVQIVPVKEVEE